MPRFRNGRPGWTGATLLVILIASGCRNGTQPLTNPFVSADRVPPPATRVIAPGIAQPYYPGDPLPAQTGQFVAPQPTFSPQPVFAQPPIAAQPAFGQAQPVAPAPAFGQPQAFGPPQTFATPPATPVTAPPATVQPFGAPGFAPQPLPAGSGAQLAPPPASIDLASASAPRGVLADDTAPVAIPTDGQAVRLAVAPPPPAFVAPPTAPSVNLAATAPASPPPTGPPFSAAPTAPATLPWISGSAPRAAAPPAPVIQTGATAPVVPSPRVRLPGSPAAASSANVGAVQITELPAAGVGFAPTQPAAGDGFRARAPR